MLRELQDNAQRFTESGLDVFLRTKNSTTVDDSEAAEYGFQVSIAETDGEDGVSDILIDPPPAVSVMSMHDIGLNQGNLMFGAHEFHVSHTWVMEQMEANNYDDPYLVFRSANIVGIFYNGRLFSLESITPQAVGNEILNWLIVGNQIEPAVGQPSQVLGG